MDPSSRNDEVDEEEEMFPPYILNGRVLWGGSTEARADPDGNVRRPQSSSCPR
ncbi:hypothetical protein JG688_00016180 [Phytophthora aleatoria]|uniref:Uncharacterized protein n=1 Tax=Phytophthora aleatoria TaxID=2496075 RepID=A0A8J5IEK5_9STRA|nr:hypothetical protein JG688_00016180 [Phytophthora aleatoria]